MTFGSYWNQNFNTGVGSISLPMNFMYGRQMLMNGTGGNIFAMPYPQTTGYGGVSSSGSSYKTAAEKSLERENSTIVSLLELLAKSEYLPDYDKQSLSEDIKNAKKSKSVEEKNEELKYIYDSYSEQIQSFLVSHKTKNLKIDGVVLTEYLDKIGYERTDSFVDNKISELHDAVHSLGKSNGSLTGSDIAADIMDSTSRFSVLDVLSSYNSAYTGENLIEKLKDKYTNAFSKKSSDTKMKDDTKTFAENLAAKLSDEAVKIAVDIDDNQIKNSLINKARNLRSVKIDDDDFVSKFNSLYAITRILTARNLGNKISANYGKVDSNSFNENMFLEATRKDLENEGLNIDINSSAGMFIEVGLSSKTSFEKTAIRKERNIDDLDIEKQTKALTSNGVLKELDDYVTLSDDDTDEYYTVYEEAVSTSENGEKKLYIIKDSEIYELFVDENGEYYTSEEPVEASKIQNEVVDKFNRERKAELENKRREEEAKSADFEKVSSILGRQNTELTTEIRTIEGMNLPVYKDSSTDKTYVIYKNSVYEVNEDGITGEALTACSLIKQASKAGYNAGKKLGNDVKNIIKGKTEDKQYDKVNDKLKNVNKQNVIGLIETCDGKILKSLDMEIDKNNPIEFENKKRIAQVLLQRAKDLGLNDTEEYKKIEQVLAKSEYKNDSDKRKSFNKLSYNKADWKWGVGSVITVASLPLSVKKVFAPVGNLIRTAAETAKGGTAVEFSKAVMKPFATKNGLKAIFVAVIGAYSIYKFATTLIKVDHNILDENMSKLCQRIKDNEHGLMSYEAAQLA